MRGMRGIGVLHLIRTRANATRLLERSSIQPACILTLGVQLDLSLLGASPEMSHPTSARVQRYDGSSPVWFLRGYWAADKNRQAGRPEQREMS